MVILYTRPTAATTGCLLITSLVIYYRRWSLGFQWFVILVKLLVCSTSSPLLTETNKWLCCCTLHNWHRMYSLLKHIKKEVKGTGMERKMMLICLYAWKNLLREILLDFFHTRCIKKYSGKHTKRIFLLKSGHWLKTLIHKRNLNATYIYIPWE